MKRIQDSGAQKRKKARQTAAIISENKKNPILNFFTRTSQPNNESERNFSTATVDCEDRHEITNSTAQEEMSVVAVIANEQTENLNEEQYNDIALWPTIIPKNLIEACIRHKPENIGDIKNSKLTESGVSRKLNDSHFYFYRANGSKEKREWLIYTETNNSLYCFTCKLFSTKSNVLKTGCSDWKNIIEILKRHENSKEHKNSMCVFVHRSNVLGRIDSQILKQFETQSMYWRKVLTRVVATVKLLSSLGLAFRGHDSARKGNFMSCMEYLAEFDNFLKLHMENYSKCGTGNVNYLSNTVVDEFIALMATYVRTKILDDIKQARYFAIVLDSTPDVSHNDQLSFIIRYMDREHMIQESFFGFINIVKHDATYLQNILVSTIADLSLDIKNCRGQTYDNAANMSGLYNGLQAKVKNHSKNAIFIPCAAHSLNLIGNSAAESSSKAVRFFGFIQNLFVFFSSSTKRWDLLSNAQFTLKRIIDTRWSARADAVLAVRSNFNLIKESLKKISNDPNEKPITKLEAKNLLKHFEDYETVLLLILWNAMLQRINSTNKTLQKKDCNLQTATSNLKSLSEFIFAFRNSNEFENIEAEACILAGNKVYKSVKERLKKRKLQYDENTNNDTVLKGKELFLADCFYIICDNLISEIKRRTEVYEQIMKTFAIFVNLNLQEDSAEYIYSITNIKQKYEDDIDTEAFKDEVAQFLFFVKGERLLTPLEMYRAIHGGLISTFPNVEIILKIFLTVPVANASAERSFSVMKRVKNYLRNTMSQEKLSNLAILCIENDKTNDVNYDSIINDFAEKKARKVAL